MPNTVPQPLSSVLLFLGWGEHVTRWWWLLLYIALFSALEHTHSAFVKDDSKSSSFMLLYVHRNHKAYKEREPGTATSTFTQLLSSEILLSLFIVRFWISTEVVYWQRCLAVSVHGWCHVKLLPSRRVLCTPYSHAPCHVTSCKATYVGCICV